MNKLSGVYGHDLIRERLFISAKSGKLLNSYIFEGAKGSGKKTLADIFAASILCKSKEENLPCKTCDACQKVFSHNHPDVLYITKDEGKKSIGVSNIRDNVISNVYIKPLISDKKLVIIKDGECLSEQAQNALLKVLEEPPEYLSFIIITESADALLKTVLSRSVVFPFMPLSSDLVEKILRSKKGAEASDEEIRFAVSFSQGIPGRGLEILENEDFSRLYTDTTKKMLDFLSGRCGMVEIEKHLAQEKENVDLVIEFMQAILRDVMLTRLGKKELVISKKYNLMIENVAKKLSISSISRMIETVLEYKERLDVNAGFLAVSADMLLKLSNYIKILV